MMVKIIDNTGFNDIGTIEKLEKSTGIQLPSQYRKFLTKYNGGYPIPDGFLLKDKSDGSSVDRFLGIDVGENSNLEKYLNTYKNRIPTTLFPIAHDPGGNLILIGVTQDALGKIYFWDHERETDDCEPNMSNVYLIADNFDDFINELYTIEE